MIEASKLPPNWAAAAERFGLPGQLAAPEVELLDAAFVKLQAAASGMPQAWSGLARRRNW